MIDKITGSFYHAVDLGIEKRQRHKRFELTDEEYLYNIDDTL